MATKPRAAARKPRAAASKPKATTAAKSKASTAAKPKAATEEVQVGDAGGRQMNVEVAGSLWRKDPKTGELCIGDDCMTIRIGEDGDVALEMDPLAETCATDARKRVRKALLDAADGNAVVKFRRKPRQTKTIRKS